jgi:hypothetical protein
MEVIKNEFTNTKQSNWDILSDEEKNKQVLWLENEYYSKISSRENEVVEEPMNYETAEPRMMDEVEMPVLPRITPIRAPRFDYTPTQAG